MGPKPDAIARAKFAFLLAIVCAALAWAASGDARAAKVALLAGSLERVDLPPPSIQVAFPSSGTVNRSLIVLRSPSETCAMDPEVLDQALAEASSLGSAGALLYARALQLVYYISDWLDDSCHL